MYARVSRYEVPIQRLDDDIRGADDTQRKVAEIPGSLGLYYLVDRDSGRTMSITLWESEQLMRESEASADNLRNKTTSASSARITSIERYEVVTQPSMVMTGQKS